MPMVTAEHRTRVHWRRRHICDYNSSKNDFALWFENTRHPNKAKGRTMVTWKGKVAGYIKVETERELWREERTILKVGVRGSGKCKRRGRIQDDSRILIWANNQTWKGTRRADHRTGVGTRLRVSKANRHLTVRCPTKETERLCHWNLEKKEVRHTNMNWKNGLQWSDHMNECVRIKRLCKLQRLKRTLRKFYIS